MLGIVPTEQLVGAFSNFKCTKDTDIQEFLQSKALDYEKRGWCSTYLLVSEQQLEENSEVWVEGYFTLSNKVIELSDKVSKNRKKKLFNGLKSKKNYMHFILIGQLGKYIKEEPSIKKYGQVTATEMLDQAFEIIYQVKERITCNCVLVECKDDPKVRKIYENYGFKELQIDNGLVQYFKII